MVRIAMIEKGIVTNISLWDKATEWQPEEKYLIIELDNDQAVDIGDAYDPDLHKFSSGQKVVNITPDQVLTIEDGQIV